MTSIIIWSDKNNNISFIEIFKDEFDFINVFGTPKEWLK
jgi:hypothetical protein